MFGRPLPFIFIFGLLLLFEDGEILEFLEYLLIVCCFASLIALSFSFLGFLLFMDVVMQNHVQLVSSSEPKELVISSLELT